MANTTNQGWAKPTIGGSEDTWGATINTALDSIDTLVGSVTAAEVAKLDGLTATTAELNRCDGVTSDIQTQLNAKASSAGSTGQVFSASTLNATTVDLGDWTITESGTTLLFKIGSTIHMKLDSSGNLTVRGDVTAKDTNI